MDLKYGPYSPSRLETATCPWSFYRQYVDPVNRITRTEGLPQARGAAVHEVFEIITNLVKEVKDEREIALRIGPSDIRKWIINAISKHPAAQPETKEIIDMVGTYLHNLPMFLSSDAEVEKMLAVKAVDGKMIECDYNDSGAFARGRADILSISDDTTIAYLYDFKTQPNKEEADTFQLGMYAWIVSKLYPYLDEIRTVLYFARYGKYSGHVIWVKDHDVKARILSERPNLDPDHVISLTDVEDELITRVSIVESIYDWVAIPHKGCQYCPVLAECPLMKEVIEVDAEGKLHVKSNVRIMGDTSKAVKVAGYIHILEKLVADMKDELKEHVKAGGPIAIPGKVYCFKTEETVDWDKFGRLGNVVYSIFEKYGVDPSAYKGYSQTFSKAILYHPNEEFVKEIRAVLPMKLTSTFKGWKTS